jgi:pimeloyl-ACP methyl ester carboxylesterase
LATTPLKPPVNRAFRYILTLIFLSAGHSLDLFSQTTPPAGITRNPSFKLRVTDHPEQPLSQLVYSHALERCGWLNQLNKTLFNTRILRQPNKMRFIISDLPNKLGAGKTVQIPLEYEPDIKISCTYVDRNSSSLIVMGGGFGNPREMLAPLLALFKNHDIVIFDHIGHGLDHKPQTPLGMILHTALGVDFTEIKGGIHEESEVISVVNHFTKKKQYQNIYGMGFCYSAAIFVRAAAYAPKKLFDKLILDGAWESGVDLIRRFSDEPELYFDPQRGTPDTNKMSWAQQVVYSTYMRLARYKIVQHYVNGRAQDAHSVGPALQALNDTPILFLHGANDLLIPKQEFEDVWNSTNSDKCAVITDSRHLQNHIKYKELFAWISELFLSLPFAEFKHALISPDLTECLSEKIFPAQGK